MKILVGVTGSIACYKSYDIVRELSKKGHQIRIVLTKGAEKFIKPELFKYLGAEEVYLNQDDFNLKKTIQSVLHIDLKNWADLILIAPLSANKLSQFAQGLCSDLLTSIFLSAFEKHKILFPAMNTQMLKNPITESNIRTLNKLPNTFIHPSFSGELVCKEVGDGKLPPVEYITEFIEHFSFYNKDKKVLITTGATIAPLDPVRFLTNPSTGKTGFELAKSYLAMGFSVTLVYGSHSKINIQKLATNPNFKSFKVHTTEDMYQTVMNEFPQCDYFISAAAVSDIKFHTNSSKLKKDVISSSLNFEWDMDILASCIEIKTNQKIVSFAAETDHLSENFHKKWLKKPTNLLIGNQVHMEDSKTEAQGFGVNENLYYFVKDGKIIDQKTCSKKDLAKEILERI